MPGPSSDPVPSPDDLAADDLAATLAELGSATLGESGGLPMDPRMKAAWAGARLAAPAYAVTCAPGDNLAVHVAVTTAPAGSALVVSVGGLAERGYWGEVLTTAAETAGIKGLVIDGGVRDVSALEAHGFPVFSSMVALRGATKNSPGSVGGDTAVGGVPVRTGDWVVADADGVVVVPGPQLEEVTAAGRARAEKEQGLFKALRDGRTTVELLGLDPGPVERR